MTQWHYKSHRKASGGMRTTLRRSDKRLAWKGNEPILTTMATGEQDEKVVVVKTMGGNVKQKTAKTMSAFISDKGKTIEAKIASVVENRANRLFTRRNILTKGALIKVSVDGVERMAKVTSRPGQTGTVSAVFTEQKPEKEAKKETKTPAEPVQKEKNPEKQAKKHVKRRDKTQ